jgi:hypothetical protein
MGPLIANAAAEGYGKAGDDKAGDDKSGNDKPGQRPYHGYYYRLLTSQGPNATGGAEDYMVNGQLIGGFAIVAYPAIYGNSGVMTFMTNHDGILYERDLGEDTTRLAKAITAYDPGPEWKRSDVTPTPPRPPRRMLMSLRGNKALTQTRRPKRAAGAAAKLSGGAFGAPLRRPRSEITRPSRLDTNFVVGVAICRELPSENRFCRGGGTLRWSPHPSTKSFACMF